MEKTIRTKEECREIWANVAKENGWYSEPFFVQTFVNRNGDIVDAVSFSGLTEDIEVLDDGDIEEFFSTECGGCGSKEAVHNIYDNNDHETNCSDCDGIDWYIADGCPECAPADSDLVSQLKGKILEAEKDLAEKEETEEEGGYEYEDTIERLEATGYLDGLNFALSLVEKLRGEAN
jgi:hypothetical protein